jgi:hypothetical protein
MRLFSNVANEFHSLKTVCLLLKQPVEAACASTGFSMLWIDKK